MKSRRDSERTGRLWHRKLSAGFRDAASNPGSRFRALSDHVHESSEAEADLGRAGVFELPLSDVEKLLPNTKRASKGQGLVVVIRSGSNLEILSPNSDFEDTFSTEKANISDTRNAVSKTAEGEDNSVAETPRYSGIYFHWRTRIVKQGGNLSYFVADDVNDCVDHVGPCVEEEAAS